MTALLFHGLWKRERGARRVRGSRTGDMTLMREREKRESENGGGGGAGGAEGIWFGASRTSSLACRIPGDQHHGVSFHPQPTSTILQPTPIPTTIFFQ